MENHEVDLKEVIEAVIDYCNYEGLIRKQKVELINHIILRDPYYLPIHSGAAFEVRYTTNNRYLISLFSQAQYKFGLFQLATFGKDANPKDFTTINSLVKSCDLDNIKLAFYLLYNIIHEKHTQ